MALSKKRTTKALISLCRCAGWSVPLLLATPPPKTGFLASRLISSGSSLFAKVPVYTHPEFKALKIEFPHVSTVFHGLVHLFYIIMNKPLSVLLK